MVIDHTASGPDGHPLRLYLQTDHLGSPVAARDHSGRLVWAWHSEAFGASAPDEDPDGDGTPTTIHLRFPGQYFDTESALHYNWHRYYDPTTGRYLSPDPIGIEGGSNLFGYVGGNPLSYSDPRGLTPVAGAWAGAGVGSAFGPAGTVVGGLLGAGAGAWLGWNVVGPMLAKPPENAYDPTGPKAPGKPGPAEGFKDPKGGENWVPNPNPGKGGSSWGWQDAKGDVWCPSGQGGRSHGGPHWDVQSPGGGYRNVRPNRQ